MRQYDPQFTAIDCHCHVCFSQPIDDTVKDYEALFARLSIQSAVMLSCPGSDHCESVPDILENMKMLYLKDRLSIPCYAGAGFTEHRDDPAHYAAFAREMLEMGFDGFKTLEQHPRLRRNIGKGLDDPSFQRFFEIANAGKLPVVCHVADPRHNWDLSTATPEAIRLNRVYADSFLSPEELYAEMERVIERWPDIRFILAHFYFHSDHYERACMLMEKYPNIFFDLTPGGEMFVNFGKDPALWRGFFLKYADRILLGSDHYAPGYGAIRYKLVRNFFEGRESFDYYGSAIHPMPLPREVLEKIYRSNALSVYGARPKPVNRALAYEYCRRILEAQRGQLTETGRVNLEIMMNHWKQR